MFNKTFLELLVIKNLNFHMLTKLEQYLGKYFNLSCLYMLIENGIHSSQDLRSKIDRVVVLLVYHDIFLVLFLIHETIHKIDIELFYISGYRYI